MSAEEVTIEFEVIAYTHLGQWVSVVGSTQQLGRWDPTHAPALATDASLYPKWIGKITCARVPTEFKFVKFDEFKGAVWEDGNNRYFAVADKGVVTRSGEPGEPTTATFGTQDPSSVPRLVTGKDDAVMKVKEPRRSNSLSLLPETGLVAEHWGRCRDLSGPPLKEQCLILKIKGIAEREAKKLSVEVVFKANSQKPTLSLDLTSWDAEGLQAAWSLAVTAAELPPGFHLFHFRVNGAFALSGEHIRVGRWNALHLSDPIRRYLLARDSRGQLLEEGRMVEKTRSKRIGDMAFDSVVGDASSADAIGLQECGGQIARPYSVCGHLALGDSDEEHDKEGVAPFAPFAKKEVYEGLFDRELMLRLDGVVLPEVPQPTLQLEGEDAGCALRLWAGAHMIQKAHGACEDAFFMDPHGLGVADGVGCMVQFASYGINAAKYATELMEFSSAALKSDGVASEEEIPNDVVGRAATALQHAESQAAAYGASTVAVLCQQGNFLGVANLGDSGFMVLRKGPLGMSIVIKSEEQQHSWNCPYQLTRLPKTLLNRFPKLQLDKASDCERFTVPIREGDLVIMFSDGLRDNLHDREVVSLVNRTLPPLCADLVGLLDRCTPPETIAKTLALAAQERSVDPNAKVPFVEYSKRHGFECTGGKQDDITVVAAWVVADESQPNPDDLDVDEIVEEMKLAEAEEERLRKEEEERLRKEEEERLRKEAEERLRKEGEERLRKEEEERLCKEEEEERLRKEAEERLRKEAEERLRKEEEERLCKEEEERLRKEEEERLRQEAEERLRKEGEERLRKEEMCLQKEVMSNELILEIFVRADTCFGQCVSMVGSTPELGSWNPAMAPKLTTDASQYPLWFGKIRCSSVPTEFKFVKFDEFKGAVWEDGNNRYFAVADKGVVTRSGEPGEPTTALFGTQDPWYVPRLVTGKEDVLQMEGEDAGCALRLWAGGEVIKKDVGGCEDAFFVNPHALGVADGVGCFAQAKYKRSGVNTALYAAELMDSACAALKPDGVASEEKIPNNVASRAAAAVEYAESHVSAFGGSTIAVLCQQGNSLGVANLGDSGFMVLRKGPLGMSIVIKSKEQQHQWNTPFHLARLPESLISPEKLQQHSDKASACELYTVPIREGDLVIMFSDGFSDNIFDKEVVSLVNLALPPMCADLVGSVDRCMPPKTIAETLAQEAYKKSVDPRNRVPYQESAKKFQQRVDPGGKPDDITVVAAWVVTEQFQPHDDFDELLGEMQRGQPQTVKAERLRLEEDERLHKEEEERLLLKEEERLSKEEEFHSKEGRRWGTLLEAMGSAKGRGSPSRRRGLL